MNCMAAESAAPAWDTKVGSQAPNYTTVRTPPAPEEVLWPTAT
jgi:hypothetical protein